MVILFYRGGFVYMLVGHNYNIRMHKYYKLYDTAQLE